MKRICKRSFKPFVAVQGRNTECHALFIFTPLYLDVFVIFFFLLQNVNVHLRLTGLMHRCQETAKGAQRICFHVGKVASDQHQDEEEEEG